MAELPGKTASAGCPFHCPSCDFDLRTRPVGAKCPECGLRIPTPRQAAEIRNIRRSLRIHLLGLAIVLAAVIAAAVVVKLYLQSAGLLTPAMAAGIVAAWLGLRGIVSKRAELRELRIASHARPLQTDDLECCPDCKGSGRTFSFMPLTMLGACIGCVVFAYLGINGFIDLGRRPGDFWSLVLALSAAPLFLWLFASKAVLSRRVWHDSCPFCHGTGQY